MGIRVKLTPDELRLAGYVGMARFAKTVEERPKERSYDDERHRMEKQVIGAWGEYAVARYLGLSWPLTPGFGRGDIGLGAGSVARARRIGRAIEVRTTLRVGVMYLHDEDDDESAYVGVLYIPHDVFEILGWTFAREGKDKDFLQPAHSRCPRPFYEYPSDLLHSIDSLREYFPQLYPTLCPWEYLGVRAGTGEQE